MAISNSISSNFCPIRPKRLLRINLAANSSLSMIRTQRLTMANFPLENKNKFDLIKTQIFFHIMKDKGKIEINGKTDLKF